MVTIKIPNGIKLSRNFDKVHIPFTERQYLLSVTRENIFHRKYVDIFLGLRFASIKVRWFIADRPSTLKVTDFTDNSSADSSSRVRIEVQSDHLIGLTVVHDSGVDSYTDYITISLDDNEGRKLSIAASNGEEVYDQVFIEYEPDPVAEAV